MMKKYVILISGRGSNMLSLLEAQDRGLLPGECVGVISNRPDVAGLARAQEHGVATFVLDHKQYSSREAFDLALIQQIDALGADLVVLAGFMRVLGNGFVRHYAGRLLNIHPSLLPTFPGLATHAQALKAGVKVHGATVHFVVPELDAGPIIIQATIPVLAEDDANTLAQRLLQQEHRIYPQAVAWWLQGRLSVVAGVVQLLPATTSQSAQGEKGSIFPPMELPV